MGLQLHTVKTYGQIYDIMFTFHDIVTSIQLSTNFNLTVCIFESRHDIKNLTTSSYAVPLKTPKTELEVIPPKDEEGDTFKVKTLCHHKFQKKNQALQTLNHICI